MGERSRATATPDRIEGAPATPGDRGDLWETYAPEPAGSAKCCVRRIVAAISALAGGGGISFDPQTAGGDGGLPCVFGPFTTPVADPNLNSPATDWTA